VSKRFVFDEAALVTTARSWLGTPFHPNSGERGPKGGVCCHLLVTEIYKACGFDLREVPMGLARHANVNSVSIMEPFLDTSEKFLRISTEPEPGDLLGYKINKVIHHVAIMLPQSQIVHALNGFGVIINPYADSSWRKRHAGTWRPQI
jgi:cell wall-associated NlpC family hydrolase